jgi:lysophospholipase L1-like esterase
MMPRVFIALFMLTAAACGDSRPAEMLPANARLAIVGDSITEQKLYSKFIETYLLACAGRHDIKCFQFGWGGERASGFALREENDLSVFKPTVISLCYGMNDGLYVPYADAIGADYENFMRNVLTKASALGVKAMVVGSPGAVDTRYFAARSATAAEYNENLAHLRDIDKKLAGEFHQIFADVHDPLTEAMAKAKAALGDEYDVCGRDGVHPQANGHLIMASVYLKALGCDGDIGAITVDMKGATTASAGHEATGSHGTAEVVSTKWPFCFDADPLSSGSDRSILPFCTFNQDLNRFTLRVKNLDAPKAKVTWGAESKEFTKEQLANGINLAAEFARTPFDGAFAALINAVRLKQEYETPMIKNMISNFRGFAKEIKTDPEFASALENVKNRMMAKHEKLDAEARKLLVPVKHTIRVEGL